MDHPNLPGQVIEVFESAVPMHMASGWAPLADAPDPRSPEQELPARNAKLADWQEAARRAGVSEQNIADSSRDELVARLTDGKE
jgi:hypothetical protein